MDWNLFFRFSLLLCLIQPVRAQNPDDSLLQPIRDAIREKMDFNSVIALADTALTTLYRRPAGQFQSISKVHLYRAIALYENNCPQAALTDLRKAKAWCEQAAGTDKILLGDIFMHTGNAYGRLVARDSASFYFGLALKCFDPESPRTAFVYNSMAGILVGNGLICSDSAICLRQRALRIFDRDGHQRHAFATENNLALLYRHAGDPGRALLFFEKAEKRLPYFKANARDRAIFFANYAMQLSEMKRRSYGWHQLRKAWAAVTENPKDTATKLIVLEYEADCYRFSNEFDSALQIDQARLQLLKTYRSGNRGDIAHVRAAIALDFMGSKRYDECLIEWDATIGEFEKIYGSQHQDLAEAFCQKAVCLRTMGKLQRADLALDQSLKANGFHGANIAQMLHLETALKTFYEKTQVSAARMDYAKTLTQAFLADSCALLLRSRIRADESKLRLAALTRPLYETGVVAAAQLFARYGLPEYFEAAFYFSEQSKNLLLAEQLRAFDPDVRGDEVLDSLRVKIALASSKRHLPGIDQLVLEREISAMTDRYFDLLDTMKMQDEPFFKRRFCAKPVSVAKFFALCKTRGQTVASYFLTDSMAFVFLFKPDAIAPELLRLPLDFRVGDAVADFLNGIVAYSQDPYSRDSVFNSSLQKYQRASRLLSERIFNPVRVRISSECLHIIADGDLCYLPFEALLTTEPAYMDDSASHHFEAYHFLAEEMNIFYGFSASIVHELSRRSLEFRPWGKMLVFAPFAYKPEKPAIDVKKSSINPEFPEDLPSTETDSQQALKRFEGRSFLRSEARLDSFLRYAPEADILFPTTHGLRDSSDIDQTYLLFSGIERGKPVEPISAPEIARLMLRARLAYLSFCESGTGVMAPGEGVLSVGRAFACAGVTDVAMTLWKVPSLKSSEISDVFFEKLQSGEPPERALWLAKKAIIQKSKGRKRLPFWWAGFVIYGDGW